MVLLQMQIQSSLPFFLLFIILISTFPVSLCQKNVTLFQNCSTPFRCGEKFPNITYPFWGGERSHECGEPGFRLNCGEEGHVTIEISGYIYRVLSMAGYSNITYFLNLTTNSASDYGCPQDYGNRRMDVSPFRPIHPFRPIEQDEVQAVKLYSSCRRDADAVKGRTQFSCTNPGGSDPAEIDYYFNDSGCNSSISVPALRSKVDEFVKSDSLMNLWDLVYAGFRVEYTFNWQACVSCLASKGLCWSGTNSTEKPTCLCPDGSTEKQTCLCPDGSTDLSLCRREEDKKGPNIRAKILIGFGTFLGTALIAALLFIVYKRRQTQRTNSSSTLLSGDVYSSYSSSALDPEKCISNFGVHIFDYYELEEATNNFDPERELGDGGFGTVYKGKLKDGRDVAVKRLYENNFKRVDHFKNEVIILTRLRHKNLVTLYGCTSRHSRELLLVYEYIPNGTVADHLHGALAKPGSLPWNTRMKIAVETASALCYLHASDVIHRDVKTNNILLDTNFCVKVADFGLSRLFPIHMTHISTAPQGTPGYVDPEYHQCYQLTDRSDVFSFGVVLIELITSMPAVDITRHRHEINLSNLAISKIQSKTLHEIVDPNLGFETDETVRLMVLDVAELAFQSLQQGRDMRPSMQEVLEALKHIQSKDGSSGNVSEVDNQVDEAKLLEARNVTFSPNSVIEGWTSSTTTPSISN